MGGSCAPPLHAVLGIVVDRGEVVDVFEGDDRLEFFGLAREPTGFDVNPPAIDLLMDTEDEDVVRGSAEVWVVGQEAGVFVTGKDAGVVQAHAEVVGCAGGGTGVADAGGGVHRPVEEVEAVLVGGAGGGDGHDSAFNTVRKARHALASSSMKRSK